MSVRSFQRFVLPSFKTYPWLFFCTISSINKLEKQIFANETGSPLFELRIQENCGSVASFLKESGFSDTLLGKIEKAAPDVYSSKSKLEKTIKPKINILKNMGLSTAEIANVVSAYPQMLNRSSHHNIEHSFLALKKLLGDKFYDARIHKNFGRLMNYDLEKTLVTNVKFMHSCGIQESQIMQLLHNYPTFLLCKAVNFKEFVRRLDEMGVDRESELYVYALRTIGSMSLESWEQKLDVFRELGYTEDEVLSTFKRFPNVYALSSRKIKETAEFLLSSGKYDRAFILRYPYIFIFSLERRLKPRSRVLDILERRKILKFKPIPSVFIIPDSNFFARFVKPYLDEIEELSFMINKASNTFL